MTASDDFNQALENLLEARAKQAWQDGHDTALINGQSQNPHDKENQ